MVNYSLRAFISVGLLAANNLCGAFVVPSAPFVHSSRTSTPISATELSAHTLVLVRHGESTWNNENRFTGWYDCPLSEKGESEAKSGGK